MSSLYRRVRDWAGPDGRLIGPAIGRAWAALGEQLRLPLHRNGFALLFGSGATSILGLAYWVLAARLYPAEIVGLNSALLAVMLFLSGLGQLGVNAALIRFIPQAGRRTARLIVVAYLIAVGIAGLATWVFYIGVAWWAPALSFVAGGLAWQLAMLVAVVGWSLFSLQDNVLTGLRSAVWVPLENTVFSIAKIVLLVVCARMFPAYGILLSWVAPAVVLILPVNLLIFARLTPAQTPAPAEVNESLVLRQILRFGAGNFVGSLFFVVYNTLLPVLVTNQVGASANAYFYLPWTIASSIQLIGQSLASSLVVEAALDELKLREFVKRILAASFGLLLPIIVVILIGAQTVLQIYGAAYAAEGPLLLDLLVVAAIPATIVAVGIGLMRAQNHNRQLVLSQGALCAAALGLAYMLLPRYGITGVGLAWLVAQSGVAVYLLLAEFRPLFRHKQQPDSVENC